MLLTFIIASITLFYCLTILVGSDFNLDDKADSKNESHSGENQDLFNQEIKPFLVIVPAKDEELLIGEKLEKTLSNIECSGHVLVIADNCTDATAEIARSLNVQVLERFNNQEVGKGHALQFALDNSDLDSFETIVVLDADSSFIGNGLNVLVRESQFRDMVMQSVYLCNEIESKNTKTPREFLWLLKNAVRAHGLNRLGIPCQLYGCGMAFPAKLIKDLGFASSSIVEDRELSLLLLKGRNDIRLCSSSVVQTSFPSGEDSSNIQNQRWLLGHMLSTFANLKELFNAKLLFKSPQHYLSVIDCLIPPLSIWLIILVICCVASFLLGSASSVAVLFFSFGALVLAVGWTIYKQEDVHTLVLFASTLPTTLLGRFKILGALFSSGSERWNKTPRE